MGYYWSPLNSTCAGELRGRPLRYLLVTLLVDARTPLTVRQLIDGCADEGVVFDGRASKIISDALRWEVRSGRVERLARGVYKFGRVPESTMRWIKRRVAQTRCWLHWVHVSRQPQAGSERNAAERWKLSDPSWVPDWPYWPSLDP